MRTGRQMSSSLIFIKRLLRKSRVCKDRGISGCKAEQTHRKALFHDPTRQSVVLSKKENEAFGFEIKTYNEKNTNDSELVTRVFSVRDDSPAKNAGLRTGDVIISVNNIKVECFAHQQIVDLIQKGSCLLRMEIERGNLKHKELQKKLHDLQWQLREKWEMLQLLTVQEERLRGDVSNLQCQPDLLKGLVLEHLKLPSHLLLQI